uniref:BRO-A n=1 Tax=Lymantria dispar multicapsid nuclear polyhedrosis virus TaxID=10449 RepID=A0A140HR87_NPVLD|nr:BRO-A [Lymantria dispar multiple nucleopolyhedrovirus]
MALSKVEFVNGPLEVFTVQDDKQENWMAANPFAETLKYLNVNRAIRVHVSKHNQKTLDELQSDRNGLITSSLHPQTKFINRAGVFELSQRDAGGQAVQAVERERPVALVMSRGRVQHEQGRAVGHSAGHERRARGHQRGQGGAVGHGLGILQERFG